MKYNVANFQHFIANHSMIDFFWTMFSSKILRGLRVTLRIYKSFDKFVKIVDFQTTEISYYYNTSKSFIIPLLINSARSGWILLSSSQGTSVNYNTVLVVQLASGSCTLVFY